MRAPATPSEAERFPFDLLDEVWPWSAAAVPPGPAVPLAPSPAPVPAEILAFPDAVAAGTAAAPAAAGIGTPAARSPAAGNAAAMGQNGPGDSSATPTATAPSETGVGSAADAAPAGEDARTPILPGAAGDLPAACNAAATGQDGPGRIPGAQGAAEAAAGGGSGGNGPAGAADPPPGPGPEVLRHHDGERGRGAADLLSGPGPAPEGGNPLGPERGAARGGEDPAGQRPAQPDRAGEARGTPAAASDDAGASGAAAAALHPSPGGEHGGKPLPHAALIAALDADLREARAWFDDFLAGRVEAGSAFDAGFATPPPDWHMP